MVPEILSAMDIIFCNFGPFFEVCSPPSSNDPENQSFEEIKQTTGDIIVLHMCIIYVVEMLQKCCAMLRSKADMLLCKFSPIYVLLTVHFSVFFETLLLQ